ncbi:3-deoxy-D-manno-octulosonic acid transferase [Ruegeria denitrificans]|uniref:3-deoxy-D-manno-octulosonic acid transferase n=1 Tax=Ruegeria denitrificans TaxID=1715692 RepID=A0A0N7MAH7_9RHOB|nr:glycosyltransferase N-terminal domain-containing protein [Ruegeria denitrificans]CUK11835.1 3-deoxy-D-manno-octulosonic acid transferase [Ruegeria denitrificans]
MSKPGSLSLAAYRVLSWGVPNAANLPEIQRPEGELIWVHINAQERQRAVVDFCHRLQQARPTLNVLLTAPPEADLSRWDQGVYPLVNLPLEQTGAARAFLDYWHPDIGLWVGGGLMPNAITRAEERSIPLILIEAQIDIKIARSARWLPDITRYTLDCFQSILATKSETTRTIRRLGITSGKVTDLPQLYVSPNPKPWPEDELIETNHALAGRPVWLAACVQDKEFISVLSAHRQALRILPRLTLVLHVADTAEAEPLHRRLETMDLRCTNWDTGGQIEDTTQVILSAEPEDLGLWHRVSPVTFMGSSLERGASGHDPLVAVALGSSVIHGPFVHRHQQIYDQLDRAGAARMVRTATELGDAVVELLSPDRAADMALAGWQIVSEGAPQADQLIDMVQDSLDQRSAE